MKNLLTSECVLVILSIILKFSAADEETIKCDFSFPQPTIYACGLAGVTIRGDEKTNFTIDVSGHLEGLTNENVTKIEIYGGSVPFIISELFVTFPNIRFLTISLAGLTRIQSYAFRDAINLETLVSYMNPLQSIYPQAFDGASNLLDIDLSFNEIEKISDDAFIGLDNLLFLNLAANKIAELQPAWLKSLPSLTYLQLAMNQLTTLEANTFSNNRLLRLISFISNQIDSIEEGILDSLDNLVSFNLEQNKCADFHWIIDGSTTIETLQDGLQKCYANFGPKDDARKFVLELRGSLTLYDEHGKEILRL